MGSDIAKAGLVITGGVFGLGFGRQIAGPRIERAAWYGRKPRLGKFVRDSVIVAATIAGAAIGTAIGDKVFGGGGPGVDVTK